MTLQIVCNNCGAKYRLPETFQNDHAKCKQCGSVIDVAAQRQSAEVGAAPAAPAAARPATARPAHAAPASSRSEAGDGKGHGERHSRRHHGDEPKGEEAGEGHGHHGHHGHRHGHHDKEPKKGGMGVAVGSGIALVAVVAVGVIWWLSSGETPAVTPVAGNTPTAETGKEPGKAAAGASAGQGAAKPQEATTDKPPTPTPAEQPKAPEPQKPSVPEPAKPAAQSEPDLPPGSPAWMKSKITTMDEVFDPKTLTPVDWPDAVTEEQRKHVEELLETIGGGGTRAIRAKKELEELGWVGFAGIVNRLREIDYKDSFDSMLAYELNKILENITVSLNTGFATVNAGENIDPRKVDHNAKTAKAWQGITAKFPTPESLAEHRKKKLAEKADK